eukprot:Hpha_TRINITY_DN24541_c0_g1::TRINITY_DN24541_c0_g1_i1::g.172550::m.172550
MSNWREGWPLGRRPVPTGRASTELEFLQRVGRAKLGKSNAFSASRLESVNTTRPPHPPHPPAPRPPPGAQVGGRRPKPPDSNRAAPLPRPPDSPGTEPAGSENFRLTLPLSGSTPMGGIVIKRRLKPVEVSEVPFVPQPPARPSSERVGPLQEHLRQLALVADPPPSWTQGAQLPGGSDPSSVRSLLMLPLTARTQPTQPTPTQEEPLDHQEDSPSNLPWLTPRDSNLPGGGAVKVDSRVRLRLRLPAIELRKTELTAFERQMAWGAMETVGDEEEETMAGEEEPTAPTRQSSGKGETALELEVGLGLHKFYERLHPLRHVKLASRIPGDLMYHYTGTGSSQNRCLVMHGDNIHCLPPQLRRSARVDKAL